MNEASRASLTGYGPSTTKIRNLSFDGDPANFEAFEVKFKAYLRLRKIKIDVVRFQENHILVSNVPFDKKFVTKWSPQLDTGVKVKIIENSKAAAGVKPAKNENIKLNDKEREKLINAVESNKWIPKDVKKRLIKQLNQELVPKKVVDRLRKRMGG